MFTAIICLIVGLVLILLKKLTSSKLAITIIGVIFIAIGLLLVFQELYGENRLTQILLTWLICGSSGVSSLFWGAYLVYERIFLCSEKLDATFIEIHTCKTSKGRHIYYPVFSYCTGGQKYTKRCNDFYNSEKQLKHKFKKDQLYPIYVSRKNPKIFVLSKRIRLIEVLLIVIGSSLIAAGVTATL